MGRHGIITAISIFGAVSAVALGLILIFGIALAAAYGQNSVGPAAPVIIFVIVAYLFVSAFLLFQMKKMGLVLSMANFSLLCVANTLLLVLLLDSGFSGLLRDPENSLFILSDIGFVAAIAYLLKKRELFD